MALPPAAGWWADQRFHTEPWLMCLGAVLGLAISMVEILRLAKEANDSGR